MCLQSEYRRLVSLDQDRADLRGGRSLLRGSRGVVREEREARCQE
jgi:hypothetical protein